jgi:branched-chain amino acid aminotransferase
MTQAQTNIHDAQIDPRNLNILISVNGKLVPRAEAMVSVFDSGFILGDGVWEGLRVVEGGVPFLRAHIERLYEGAKAIFMDVWMPMTCAMVCMCA